MKKILSFAAAFIICLSMGAAAAADVIFEPTDNFYRKHSEEITRIGRGGRFYTISEETDVYSDPGVNVTGILSPGKSPCISFYYTDKNGKQWGGYLGDEDDEMLWICLDGTELIYDGISFREEHGDEFYEHKGEYNELKIDGSLFLYEYPGSSEYIEMETHPSDFGSYISSLYKDENGSVWGHISYIWGSSGWVCAEQAEQTPTAEISETQSEMQSKTETEAETLPSSGQTSEIIAAETKDSDTENETVTETEISPAQSDETSAAQTETAETFSETVEKESAEASSAQSDSLLEDSVYTKKRTVSDYMIAAGLSLGAVALVMLLFKVLGVMK